MRESAQRIGDLDHSELGNLRLLRDEELKSSVEHLLKDIWSSVLRIQSVSVDDNFIDLGGDSLVAVRIIIEIQTKLGITISLANVFDNMTITSLSKVIGEKITHSTGDAQ